MAMTQPIPSDSTSSSFFLPQPSPPSTFSNSPTSACLKRRAPSPNPVPYIQTAHVFNSGLPDGVAISPSSPTEVRSSDHRDKRPRPNLANGFSGLSITPRAPRGDSPLPTYEESEETRNHVDDNDWGLPTISTASQNLHVEELQSPTAIPKVVPDYRALGPSGRSGTSSHHASSSASSETSSDEEDSYDSDATYRLPVRKGFRAHTSPQVADQVWLPDGSPLASSSQDVEVRDVTDTPEGEARGRKRRAQDDARQARRKHRKSRNDMDVDGGTDDAGTRSRKTRSYEVEPDRIVVTSLSDSSDSESSRSPSPTRRDLIQPGERGFTLSPSLLTHLLSVQREGLLSRPANSEQGLVLYRPMPWDPAQLSPPPWQDIVTQWNGNPALQSDIADSSRFEEINDDSPVGEAMELD